MGKPGFWSIKGKKTEDFDLVRDRIVFDTSTFTALAAATSNNAGGCSEEIIVDKTRNGNLFYKDIDRAPETGFFAKTRFLNPLRSDRHFF